MREIRVDTAFKPHRPSGSFGLSEAASALRELPKAMEQVMYPHVCTWTPRGMAQGPGGILGGEWVSYLVLKGPVFSKDRQRA